MSEKYKDPDLNVSWVEAAARNLRNEHKSDNSVSVQTEEDYKQYVNDMKRDCINGDITEEKLLEDIDAYKAHYDLVNSKISLRNFTEELPEKAYELTEEEKEWLDTPMGPLDDWVYGGEEGFDSGQLTLNAKLPNSTDEESDPNGVEQHTPGAKLDAGKVRAGLVLGDFCNALMSVSDVGTFGANKYTDHGWLEVEDGVNRYMDAMLRHFLKHKAGEELDPDSGKSHLAHMAWNALAVLELTERKK